jgi:hypothetical protein
LPGCMGAIFLRRGFFGIILWCWVKMAGSSPSRTGLCPWLSCERGGVRGWRCIGPWQGRWGLSRRGLAPLRICFSGFAEAPDKISLFISLLAQRNEPKKGPPVSLVPPKAGCPVLLDAAGALQTRLTPQTVQIPFSAASPVLGCVPMGILSSPPICPAAPRRRGRKKTRELSEGEARVFPRPAPGEK